MAAARQKLMNESATLLTRTRSTRPRLLVGGHEDDVKIGLSFRHVEKRLRRTAAQGAPTNDQKGMQKVEARMDLRWVSLQTLTGLADGLGVESLPRRNTPFAPAGCVPQQARDDTDVAGAQASRWVPRACQCVGRLKRLLRPTSYERAKATIKTHVGRGRGIDAS